MGFVEAIRERLRHWPAPSDAEAVSGLTARQWAGIAQRTPTYLEAYTDRPGADGAGQRRARWIAARRIFDGAMSALEIGCGAGRNLAELNRRHPGLMLLGADICAEGLAAARRAVPQGDFYEGDLYGIAAWPAIWSADVAFTCGVLCHLHPDRVGEIAAECALRARYAVMFVEEWSPTSTLLKGPAPWHPTVKATGDYMCWSVSEAMVKEAVIAVRAVRHITVHRVPEELATIGARRALIMWFR